MTASAAALPRWSILLLLLLLVLAAVAKVYSDENMLLLRPGFILVLDADAGPAQSDGERTGVVFSFREPSEVPADPLTEPPAPTPAFGHDFTQLNDSRWLDPVDLGFLPDGTVLLLESRWSPLGGEAAGALFALPEDREQASRVLWSDPRLRQPVALAVGPEGRVYISDRSADPLGLGQPTGCVFVVDLDALAAGRDDAAQVLAAGPELVTPGALLFTRDGRLLLMDADANPLQLPPVRGVAATPGELFLLGDAGLESLLRPDHTVSPVGLIEGPDGTLWLVDANQGSAPPNLGRGALFRIGEAGLELVLDASDAADRLFIDPTGGMALADGRLIVADANADPFNLGPDGSGRGVYGTGRGCVLLLDPNAAADGSDGPRVRAWITHPDFVTPLKVARVPRP